MSTPNKAKANTALSHAAKTGNITGIKQALADGADINCAQIFNNTPLLLATNGNHADAVRTLLELKADPNLQNSSFAPPLLYAIRNATPEVTAMLLEAGADPDAKRGDIHRLPEIPLAAAAQREDFSNLELLYRHGVNIEGKNNDGYTALHTAATRDKPGAIAWLLNHGANIDAFSHNEHTPLMIAADNGSEKALARLLENGANVNAVGRQGRALDLALFGGRVNCILKLLQYGAKPELHPYRQNTIAGAAQRGKMTKWLRVLTAFNNEAHSAHTAASVLQLASRLPEELRRDLDLEEYLAGVHRKQLRQARRARTAGGARP